MKKVVIAIDYNPSVQKVAEAGYAYARLMNAEVSIIHAIADISNYTSEYVPIMGFEGFSPDRLFMNTDEQKYEAYNFLECVALYLGDKNIKTYVLDGRTSETILEYATRWNADLIVMGMQNYNGFEKLNPGNITSLILKRSGIPVLIIPPEKEEANSKNLYKYLRV